MPPIRGGSTSSAAAPITHQVHVPRPPNAFMLFRRHKYAEMRTPEPGEPRWSQGELSRRFAKEWKNLTPEEKAYWERQAAEKDAEHKAKYPNYKYQPMKKEEKTRLAEERKAEKKRAAATKKQSRSTSSTTPAAANNAVQVVAPYMAQAPPSTPYNPPPQHFVPGPFVSNVDSGAPSPSMSAASTPGPDSSLNASPVPQFGSLVSPTPLTLHDSLISLPFMIARPPALATEASDYVAPANPNAGNWNLSSTAHQGSNWNESFEPAANHSLYFDISQADAHQVNTWLNEQGASLEEQIQQPQAGSSQLHAYQLEHFNLGNVVSGFNSELSVRVGDLPPLEHAPNYITPGFSNTMGVGDFCNEYQSESEFSGLYPDSDAFSQFFDLTFLADDSSLTFMNTSTAGDFAALDVALQPVENAAASSSAAQPYVPPSGAANSGNRRVAASYRKDSLYSLDQSSPLPA